MVLACHADEVEEEGVWLQHRTLILGVELRADVPFQPRYLHNLDKVALGIASHAVHAVALKLLLEVVVELITVAVALLNVLRLIYIEHARTLF